MSIATAITSDGYRSVANIAKLVSDPTRARLIGMVGEGPLNVTQMCEGLSQSQPAVSHHLALLRVAGVMQADRSGKNNIYSLTKNGQVVYRMVREIAAFG